MTPDTLVTYTEAAQLPPASDARLTVHIVRKAREDGRLPNAVQEPDGRRAWRVTVGDLVGAGLVCPSVYTPGHATTAPDTAGLLLQELVRAHAKLDVLLQSVLPVRAHD